MEGPGLVAEEIRKDDERQALFDFIAHLVTGDPQAGSLGELSPPERFHWLTSPRSTTIQVSPVHPGLCDDPNTALDDLYTRLVVGIESHLP